MSHTRSLAAILAADVAGYSRLMGADEEGTLEPLAERHRRLDSDVTKRHILARCTLYFAGPPRGLDRLPATRRRQIVGRIEHLAAGSANRNLDIRPLEGGSGLFLLRVGEYRVLFSVDEGTDTVTIELIRGRGDVYKR